MLWNWPSAAEFFALFNREILPAATGLVALSEGSVCFTVKAETSLALEELYERYSTGRLQRDLQEFLVTDDIRRLADGEEVKVRVHVDEKEFEEARNDLENVGPCKDSEDASILIQGLPLPQHSGNYQLRSMEESQQRMATIVYRAGTDDGPSFESDETINEAWLVTNPKLYFPLDQDLPESCKDSERIFLWETDVSTLGEDFTYCQNYDGVIKVELNDSRNSKCASKEIKKLLKSLNWQTTTVPQCSEGFSLMDLSPMVRAVIVYMKDHYPTTPEELNFHAELKAASQWYWLKDKGNTLALKNVPTDDCRLKIAVRETLKTWEKEKEDVQAKVQKTDDSDEELSEAIEVLKNYVGGNKKVEGDDLSLEDIPAAAGKVPSPPIREITRRGTPLPPPPPPREDEQGGCGNGNDDVTAIKQAQLCLDVADDIQTRLAGLCLEEADRFQGHLQVNKGSADGKGVYGFMRDLILEGKVAKWVNNSGRYVVLDWYRALDRYADYRAKKNPLIKRTNESRGIASNRLRAALLSTYKKDGAREYMESKKINEWGEVVERQFQMPPRVFKSLFRNAGLSDSGEEQDEQERKRHLSEGAVEAQVFSESSSDVGFDETMDLSCDTDLSLSEEEENPGTPPSLRRAREDEQGWKKS